MTQEKYDDIKFNKEPIPSFRPSSSHLTIGDWDFGFRYYREAHSNDSLLGHVNIFMRHRGGDGSIDRRFLEFDPSDVGLMDRLQVISNNGCDLKNNDFIDIDSLDFLNKQQKSFLKGVAHRLNHPHARRVDFDEQDEEKMLFNFGLHEVGITLNEDSNTSKYKSRLQQLADAGVKADDWVDVESKRSPSIEEQNKELLAQFIKNYNNANKK